eukprot:jgi/Picre1/29544/NNA_004930.t1
MQSKPSSTKQTEVFRIRTHLLGAPKIPLFRLHHAVIVRPSPAGDGDGASPMHWFDVIPKDPTHPRTLAALLALQSVPALLRVKNNVKHFNLQERDLVGVVDEDVEAVVERAVEFQKNMWAPEIRLLHSDCVVHSRELVSYLLYE